MEGSTRIGLPNSYRLVLQSMVLGLAAAWGCQMMPQFWNMAYKLCEYAGQGRLKLSTGKPVLPGRKQVFRMTENERDVRDVIARADEDLPGRALLVPVMRHGELFGDWARQPRIGTEVCAAANCPPAESSVRHYPSQVTLSSGGQPSFVTVSENSKGSSCHR